MSDRIGQGLKRRYFFLALLSVYYVFIGLLVYVLESTNPKELVSQLWQFQWIQYLGCLGLLSGFYLSLSSCFRLSPILDVYLKRKSYRNAGFIGLELFIQWVWALLPIELINNGLALNKVNHLALTGCIVFAVSLATFRRFRIKTMKETMEFIESF
ncbi:TPA: hypothetical protein ACI3W2_002696 [Legionella pneumophila]